MVCTASGKGDLDLLVPFIIVGVQYYKDIEGSKALND